MDTVSSSTAGRTHRHTHRDCTGSSLTGSWHCEGNMDTAPTLNKKLWASGTYCQGKSVLSTGVLLGIGATLLGRHHTQEWLINTKQTQWEFCRLFVSFCFVSAFFALVFYMFIVSFVCARVCLLGFCFVLVFAF